MQYYYYPPEWFKKTTVSPLTAWEDYRDSLLYWAEDWWDNFFEDELRSVWKITLYAGSAALILLIILFWETNSAPKREMLVSSSETSTVQEKETDAPLLEEATESKPPRKPVKSFDPFAKYAPEPEEPPSSIPPVEPFPVPQREHVPFPTKPELVAHTVHTDLLPDFQHSELQVVSRANSIFIPPQKNRTSLAGKWHRFRQADQPELAPREYISWFETPAAQQAEQSTTVVRESTPLESLEQSSAVIVMKKMPKNVTAGSEVNYELIVKNRSETVQKNIILEEVVADHHCVNNVMPAACAHEGTLRWVIDLLGPHEQRRFQITCVASHDSPVLQTETRLQLQYSLAANTVVFVPDVVVSLTLPVSVEEARQFPVLIKISNRSDRIFSESDLKIDLLQGVQIDQSRHLQRRVKIPAPGKSVTLPIKLTAVKAGTGIIQAELDLEESLMVPVTARTTIRPAKKAEESHSRDALVQKVSSQLARKTDSEGWQAVP